MSDTKVVDAMRDSHRELTDRERDQVRTVKGMGQAVFNFLDTLPPGREVSLAKTKIEEAVMWAVKGITGPGA